MTLIDVLNELIVEGERLVPLGGQLFQGYNSDLQPEYVSWRLQAISAIQELGPVAKPFLKEIESDTNSPYFYSDSATQILGTLKGALSILKRQVMINPLANIKTNKTKVNNNKETFLKEIFIVHGHDHILLQQTARFLEKLELEPIILFEKPAKGDTIIEKLERYSNSTFAVVLLTPDDVGKVASPEAEYKPRARQNVILELGFFLGKLSRSNVVVLYDESVELPSDYRGVEYIKVDADGAWKLRLARELKEAGISIDMNKAL